MPRVHTQIARASKRARYCSKPGCELGGTIQPGQKYHRWSFRYGGTRFQHAACGYPRRSQLTQSIMGEVYDAIETAEATIAAWEGPELGDLTTAVEEVASAADSVIDQYREADEAMGGHGATQSAERADELEGWKDELEGFYPDEFSGDEPAEGEERSEEQQEEFENWLDEQRNEAQGLLDNCPL